MRDQNWPRILSDFIASRENTPFAWGEHDCCLFAADAVLAFTGIDHAGPFRGKYKTAAGAAKLLKPYGGIIGYLAVELGDFISPAMAQRGDVVVIDTENGQALGVCLGSAAVLTGTLGLIRRPILEATTAWRIR